jgi:hypothetical protein
MSQKSSVPQAISFVSQVLKRDNVAIAVEAPRPAPLGDFQPRLVVAVQKFVGDLAGSILVRQLNSFRAESLDVHHRNQAVRWHAANRGIRLEILKRGHPASYTSDCGFEMYNAAPQAGSPNCLKTIDHWKNRSWPLE